MATAYYPVFHLLIEEAGARWEGSEEAITGFERSFSHAQMKSVSIQFSSPGWTDWHGNFQQIPPALSRVAHIFRELQDERHVADYNNSEIWTLAEVQSMIEIASEAFLYWATIRTHPMSGNYLLAMLLGKPR